MKKDRKTFITEHSNLHGTVVSIDKANKKAEIKLLEGYIIFIKLTKEQTTDLSLYISRKISLIGESKIDTRTLKIDSFKLEKYVIISNDSNASKFQELRNLIGEEWDKIDNPAEYLGLND
jgi:hypothetical protein